MLLSKFLKNATKISAIKTFNGGYSVKFNLN